MTKVGSFLCGLLLLAFIVVSSLFVSQDCHRVNNGGIVAGVEDGPGILDTLFGRAQSSQASDNQVTVERATFQRKYQPLTKEEIKKILENKRNRPDGDYDYDEHSFSSIPDFTVNEHTSDYLTSYEAQWSNYTKKIMRSKIYGSMFRNGTLDLIPFTYENPRFILVFSNRTSYRTRCNFGDLNTTLEIINDSYKGVVYRVLEKLIRVPEIKQMLENEQGPTKDVERLANCIAGPEQPIVLGLFMKFYCGEKKVEEYKMVNATRKFQDCVGNVNLETNNNFSTVLDTYKID